MQDGDGESRTELAEEKTSKLPLINTVFEKEKIKY